MDINAASPSRRTISPPVLSLIACLAIAEPAWAGFFGPDVEALPAAQIRQRLQERPVVFETGGAGLEVRTKGAAIGGFLVGVLLSSGGSASAGGARTSPTQMQQQMQANNTIAMSFQPEFQKFVSDTASDSAVSKSPEVAQKGPLPLLARNLAKTLAEQRVTFVAADAAAAKPLRLSLTQTIWKLEYEMLSSDYTLISGLRLELLDKEADKVHLRHECGGTYEKKMPIDEWEKDGHLAVAQATEMIARRCELEFARALDLASSAADTPAPTVAPTVPAAQEALPDPKDPEQATAGRGEGSPAR